MSGLSDQPMGFLCIGGGGHEADLTKRAEGNALKPTDPHRTKPARDTGALQIEAEELRLYLIVRDIDHPFTHSWPIADGRQPDRTIQGGTHPRKRD